MEDLSWLGCANPELSFVAQNLSQFVQNPGPGHVAAALRALAHIRKDPRQEPAFMGPAAFFIRATPTVKRLYAFVPAASPTAG